MADKGEQCGASSPAAGEDEDGHVVGGGGRLTESVKEVSGKGVIQFVFTWLTFLYLSYPSPRISGLGPRTIID